MLGSELKQTLFWLEAAGRISLPFGLVPKLPPDMPVTRKQWRAARWNPPLHAVSSSPDSSASSRPTYEFLVEQNRIRKAGVFLTECVNDIRLEERRRIIQDIGVTRGADAQPEILHRLTGALLALDAAQKPGARSQPNEDLDWLRARATARDSIAAKATELVAWVEDPARTAAELEGFDATSDALWQDEDTE